MRQQLSQLFNAACTAVRGANLITAHSSFDGHTWRYAHGATQVNWSLPASGRVIVVGAGKAAASIALGLEAVLGERIDAGCVIVKYGHGEQLRRIRILEAAHPVPDAAGVTATQQVLDTVRHLDANDSVFVVLTGGASALLVSPVMGVQLSDKIAVTQLLLRCGADINELNTVRKKLSVVKGGGLLTALGAAHSLTLMISDVPTDDLTMIGSGPTYANDTSAAQALEILQRYELLDAIPPRVLNHLRAQAYSPPQTASSSAQHVLLADSGTALKAVSDQARQLGFDVHIFDAHMQGDTHQAASAFAMQLRHLASHAASKPIVLLAAGETTLKVRGSGRGGRNQEFALVAAKTLSGVANVGLLAAGTDGTDGPTDAAGAFADGATVTRVAGGLASVEAVLANNDSYSLFATLGDLHVTGPTGTNVMDLVIGMVEAIRD